MENNVIENYPEINTKCKENVTKVCFLRRNPSKILQPETGRDSDQESVGVSYSQMGEGCIQMRRKNQTTRPRIQRGQTGA